MTVGAINGWPVVTRLPLRFLERLMMFAVLVFVATSCSTTSAEPRGAFASAWHQYEMLQRHRAIAVAGEIDRNRWVVGMAGSARSADAAIEAALGECRKQRAQKRMKDSCKIYAVGDQLRQKQPAPTR